MTTLTAPAGGQQTRRAEKTATVPRIAGLESMDYERLAAAMETGASRNYIACVNWAEYPYAPVAAFDIARSDTHLVIRYFVRGEGIRATYARDGEPVWRDSCVEFFVREPGSECYYNFEFNCIGTCLAGYGAGRNGRTPLPDGQLERIVRHASPGREPLGEKSGIQAWELIVAIPFELFGADPERLPETLRANFYKCGDDTPIPHFVSWNPIDAPSPDFHLPEFFGEIRLRP